MTSSRTVPPFAVLAAAMLLAGFALFSGLHEPLWGSEGRFAVVAREMFTSGDVLKMTIAGHPYTDKPWGSYWLILFASRLCGGFTVWSARLPGVLSFLLTVALTYWIGVRTLGRREGALAALLLATSPRLVFWSRMASADPQTLLGTTLAVFLILELSERADLGRFILLGATVGACSLMKGLGGLAVPAFVAFNWSLFVRGFRWLKPLPFLGGILAFLLMLGAPFAFDVARGGNLNPLVMLWHESVVRALEPFDHVEGFFFYVWNQFELFVPWALFLPAVLLVAWNTYRGWNGRRNRLGLPVLDTEDDRRRAFPLFGYLVIFALFTLARSQRTYYLMPAAPFLALAIAHFLLGIPSGASLRLRNAAYLLLGIVGLIAGALIVIVSWLRWIDFSGRDFVVERFHVPALEWAALPPWLPLLIAVAIPGVQLVLRVRKPGADLLPPAVFLAALATIGMVTLRARLYETADTLSRFGAQAQRIIPPGTPVEGRMLPGDAKLLFYLDRPIVPEGTEEAGYWITNGRRAARILAGHPSQWTVVLRECASHSEVSNDTRSIHVLLKRLVE